MKVVALNGSPKKDGNTYHALNIVAKELQKENIEVEIIDVGSHNISGCIACEKCKENKNEKCIIDDEVNVIIQKMKEADGMILGSPVYYSGINGTMKSFLDRAFYVAGANGGLFRHKVGASVVALRRSGGISTFQQLNNYITYSEMLAPTSNYWNIVHGKLPGDMLKDEEGVQIMRILGKNMAWLLKLQKNGKDVEAPEKEGKIKVNLIQ
ncbi:flavodoxin family protein [Serpentinicella sp. ANB-PHB4]|uniref:flavodoxin family protein n=1 Tax=Serpentinicella sp. ANB-PHB4 TaxID=3074076 RepID=UPI002854452B|nr:flavodoxin family protein [Serpentinicella sp. ANB-PHB4]MDR5659853.1 flavodoxin family protein [Serpentinicella sp. ANB-PHB4]